MKKSILAFIAGTVIGSTATRYVTKTRYEQIAQKEIDSVKDVFLKKKTSDTEKKRPVCGSSSEEVATTSDVQEEYEDLLNEVNYSSFSDSKPEKKDISEEVNPVSQYDEIIRGPYVISPDDFGECDDYERISLTYYNDGHLTDDDDELIADVDKVVGFHSLTTFGEYEDDSVYVRNDETRCDYEVLRDQRNYADVLESKRNQQEYE